MNGIVARVIGGGLAGVEAAWQLAEDGLDVELWEMRPVKSSPAHETAWLAELVCSNSLGGVELHTPAGLLKAELAALGSVLLPIAETCRVPAGGALAVDRQCLGELVTQRILAHPRISVVRKEVRDFPGSGTVIATGPLTSEAFSHCLTERFGELLAFYDAAAPIVAAESVDHTRVFAASRYGRGGEDYLNCPLNEAEYQRFWEALVSAEQHPRQKFEEDRFFEGCLPVEELAARGRDTLRFGPLRPVGLQDPVTGERPYAVVQLRQDDQRGQLRSLVGFQTSLTWPEQRRVFGLIPGLEEAEFLRFGVMHRNTFLRSPGLLAPTLESRNDPGVFMAGQLVGVEGYLESAAAGLVAGRNLARRLRGGEPATLPPTTMIGALLNHVSGADPKHFQPMNANFGLLAPLERTIRDRRVRKEALSARALSDLAAFLAGGG